MEESHIAYRATVFVGVVLACQFLWKAVSSYVRLRKIPGPFFAAVSNFWLMIGFWRNIPWRYTSKHLHAKYGPVVRYGPNRVAFNDPAAVPVILATSNVFEKADNYNVLLAMVRGKPVTSFIAARPEARHTALKKDVAAAFAPGPIQKYESLIDDTLDILSKQLTAYSPVVDLVEWLRYFAMDSLTRIGFSEDLGFMENKRDIDDTLAGAAARFDHWHYWMAIPDLEWLLFKNPLILRFAQPSSRLAMLAVRRIKARLEKKQKPETSQAHGPADLLDKYLEASEKDPATIDSVTLVGLTVSTIHAGADTTASTLGITLSLLLRHPDKRAKLEAELATLGPNPRFAELNKLRYLDACILESMRTQSISGAMLERIVPDSGASIAGTWVPGGTVVSVSHHVLNRDPKLWGPEPEVFNPDRWIEADEGQRRSMHRASTFFSAGKRTCLGQHVAWLEMKKLIPRLFADFKMELASEKELELGTGAIAYPKQLLVRLEARH